jgi:membrane-associated phospholipid phosphatase
MEQGDGILYFAERRTAFGNIFFKYFTKLGEEHIYIILVSIFVFVRFRFAILAVLSGLVALLTAWLFKTYFGHPRPFVYFTKLERLAETNPIDGIYLYSGMASFPSGHTMSAFAVFTLVALLFAHKPIWTFVCFLCALLVGISRVYLVQHFFEDIYLGAILGTLVGILIFWLQNQVPVNELKWIDRSFLHSKKSTPKST